MIPPAYHLFLTEVVKSKLLLYAVDHELLPCHSVVTLWLQLHSKTWIAEQSNSV